MSEPMEVFDADHIRGLLAENRTPPGEPEAEGETDPLTDLPDGSDDDELLASGEEE